MKTTLSLTVALSLAGVCAAQSVSSVTIPKAMAGSTRPVNWRWNSIVFYATSSTSSKSNSHVQMFYGSGDMPASTMLVRHMSYRRPQGLGNQNYAGNASFSVTMLASTTSVAKFTTTFATNLSNGYGSSKPTNVLPTTKISFTDNKNPSAWPAAWEKRLSFGNAVFVWPGSKAGSLVIDTVQTNHVTTSQNTTSNRTWYLEAAQQVNGSRATPNNTAYTCNRTGSAKGDSGGCQNNSIGYRTPTLGGTFNVTHYGFSSYKSTSHLLVAGLSKTKWGSATLPATIRSLNLPSKKNCSLYVSGEFLIPAKQSTNTSTCPGYFASGTYNIPNLKVLAGLKYYTQIAATDNDNSIYTGWASEWTIGPVPGTLVDASYMYAIGNSAGNATGFLVKGHGVTWKLDSK